MKMNQFIVLCLMSLLIVRGNSKSLDKWFDGMQSDSHSWYGDMVDYTQRSIPRGCGGKQADVYFVIDTSDDVSSEQLQKQTDFAKELVTIFYMNQDTVRIGIISYGGKVDMVTEAGEYNKHHQIRDVIDIIPRIGGKRDNAGALNYLRNKVFTPSSVRPEVGHVVIMLTNGFSTNAKSTAMNAILLRSKGVYVYTVSVGPTVDTSELESIASPPAQNFVFSHENPQLAESLIKLLHIKECDYQVSPPFEGETKICAPNRPVDIVFGVEQLGLGTRHATDIISFVYEILGEFDSNTEINTAVILSKSPNYINFGKKVQKISDVQAKLASMIFPEMSHLLKKIRRTLIRGKKDVQKTAVVFIDNNMDLTKKALIEAKRNKFMKIETYVIYIGEDYNKPELEMIANGADGLNVLIIPSYADLLDSKEMILKAICRGF
ncbi:collagen alpha-4(VI) chain [Patella vulgata]|uniref:collagen alpha-4(VI) chain n=1 Tax=Patella vulgata TaxID=6465 RepID=UPI00217FF1D6|nr:collagen alpha-4(VI) chain [Patella vulgata]